MMTHNADKKREQIHMLCMVLKSMRQTVKEIEVNVAYRWFLGLDMTEVFVDATHVKARANSRKMQKRIAREEALFYENLLKREINRDRESHGKKPPVIKTAGSLAIL